VHFPAGTPPRTAMYWRGPVLSDFDGEAWSRDHSLARLAVPEVKPLGRTWTYEATLEPTARRDIVQLDVAVRPPPGTRFNGDRVAASPEPLDSLFSFTGWRCPRSATRARPSARANGRRRRPTRARSPSASSRGCARTSSTP